MAIINPSTLVAQWPPASLRGKGDQSNVISAVDYDDLLALQREVIEIDTRIEGAATNLQTTAGAAETIAQYEIDLSGGFCKVAGYAAIITALNDQPIVGTDEWAKSFKLDGTAAEVLSADGQTYEAAFVVLLDIDGSGNGTLALHAFFGDEAADGAEVAPTGQQIRDAIDAAKAAGNLAATINADAFLVIGRATYQRVATDTMTVTHADPASDAALASERYRGYSLAASA